MAAGAGPVRWQQQLSRFFPAPLQRAVLGLPEELARQATGLRIRAARPLLVAIPGRDVAVDASGQPVQQLHQAVHPDPPLVGALLERFAGGSLYAVEEQLQRGYLTLPGGHRVGLCGRAVLERGSVRTLTEVSGFNIRLARAVEGCADHLLPRLLVGAPGRRRLASVLVVAPPGAGKTTLLRELARLASWGVPELGLAPSQVVIVDERSEIAGCYQGVPQHDVGPRTDVLDGCPKAEGILWAVRALAPDVVVTDEIGAAEDVQALLRACHSGVSLLASVHGDQLGAVRRRPGLAELLALGVFQRAVTLSLRQGPGTVEQVEDLAAG